MSLSFQAIIVCKYMFQFEFYPWNQENVTPNNEEDPFFPQLLCIKLQNNHTRSADPSYSVSAPFETDCFFKSEWIL